jgi:hypothetical protein
MRKSGIICILTVLMSCCTFPDETIVSTPGVPTPQELFELAKNLPPYSEEKDCGFEALSVFEAFGGDLVFAQQGDEVYDGIYSVEKTIVPQDLAEEVGSKAHGIYIWKDKMYIYFAGFGCYELSLQRRLIITEHRGVNMKKNGAHVWNIINGVVIDISWARQNMRKFQKTVIVKNDMYKDY